MAGMWDTGDIEKMHQANLEKCYYPNKTLAELKGFIDGWHAAVQRSLQWIK
jgi:hypothetical protein